jgi:hypothetical protein
MSEPIKIGDKVKVVNSSPSMNGMVDFVRRISEPYLVLGNGWNFRRDKLELIEKADAPEQANLDIK